MVLRSLHPPLSGALLTEMRRHLSDVADQYNQLNTDATALVSAWYEYRRCDDHSKSSCTLCLRAGPESARSRADAASRALPMLRAKMAAQLLDFLHAVDPCMTIDDWMAVLGDVWTSMQDTGREVER